MSYFGLVIFVDGDWLLEDGGGLPNGSNQVVIRSVV